MAIKPSFAPRVWDSSGIYTTGPFIGNVSRVDPGAGIAAEGHRPGSLFPTAAEHENDQQWKISKYVAEWLALGSSTGAADAHIVETNASGRAQVQGLSVIDAIDETALVVSGVNTLAPLASFTCTTGATAILVDIGIDTGRGFAVDITNGGGRAFVCEMVGGLAAARGLYISADGTSASACVELVQDGTKNAITIAASGGSSAINIAATGSGGGLVIDTSGGSGGAATITGNGNAVALTVNAGTDQSAAALVGSGTAAALDVTGGTTGDGVLVLGGTGAGSHAGNFTARNSTGRGLSGITHTTATIATVGVYAEGKDAAGGVQAVSANYYAGIFQAKTATPTWSTLFVRPQTTYPTQQSTDGSLTYASETFGDDGHWVVGCASDAALRGVHTSLGGFVHAALYNASASNADAATYTTVGTATASGGNAPHQANRYVRISVKLRVRTSTAAANGIDIKITDTTGVPVVVVEYVGAGTGATNGWYLNGLSVNWSETICFDVEYLIPATGSRTWTLQMKRQTAANTVTVQGSMIVTGAY